MPLCAIGVVVRLLDNNIDVVWDTPFIGGTTLGGRQVTGDGEDNCPAQPMRVKTSQHPFHESKIKHTLQAPKASWQSSGSLSPGELIPWTVGCLGGDLEPPAAAIIYHNFPHFPTVG